MSTRVATRPEGGHNREITPEELLAIPNGKHCELIDGQLKERPVGTLQALVGTELIRRLGNACRRERLAWVLAATQGYRCFPWKPNQVRRSSVTVLRADRVTQEMWSQSYCSIPPDMVVEMVFPGDLFGDLDRKIDDYLRAGVRLIWIVDPRLRTVQVWRSDRSGTWLDAGGELSGEDVIPGFRCRVGDLFPEEAGPPAGPPASVEAPGP
jgi:Uma2 family endonuclease